MQSSKICHNSNGYVLRHGRVSLGRREGAWNNSTKDQSSRSKIMERFVEILESYRGREKIMRLIQYSSYLISGGLPQGKLADRFLTVAEAMGECRTILRLFDGFAMFVCTRSFGLGRKVISPICGDATFDISL